MVEYIISSQWANEMPENVMIIIFGGHHFFSMGQRDARECYGGHQSNFVLDCFYRFSWLCNMSKHFMVEDIISSQWANEMPENVMIIIFGGHHIFSMGQ